MRNTKEIGDAIMTIVLIKKEGDVGVQKLLKEWGAEILNEAANRAKVEWQYVSPQSDKEIPVVDKRTITDILKNI